MSDHNGNEELSDRKPPESDRTSRARQWLRRAKNIPGQERETLLFVGKGTLATTIAWLIAHNVMAAQSPAFAPFAAILMLQVTVYQSVVQSLRFLGAVVAGVALQALIVLVVSPDLLAFGVIALIALGMTRLPYLGAQRYQVSTAAFFAFSTYVAASNEIQGYLQLGQIIVLVLVGCFVGVLVNLLVFPPLRYRGAEYGVRSVGGQLVALFEDMAPTVRDVTSVTEHADQWHQRAVRLGTTLSRARTFTQTAWESAFYNPRRVFRRSPVRSFEGHAALLDALERFSRQTTAVADDLRRLGDTDDAESEDAQGEHADSPGSTFLRDYGRYLGAVGEALQVLAEFDEDRLREQQSQLRERLDEARDQYARLDDREERDEKSISHISQASEILLIDAKRLLEELRAVGDAFGAYADPQYQD